MPSPLPTPPSLPGGSVTTEATEGPREPHLIQLLAFCPQEHFLLCPLKPTPLKGLVHQTHCIVIITITYNVYSTHIIASNTN